MRDSQRGMTAENRETRSQGHGSSESTAAVILGTERTMRHFYRILYAGLIFLVCACASGLKFSAARFPAGQWSGRTLVQTHDGLINGHRDLDNTFAWLGIPYASPPVGDLRWKAPREPAARPGTYEADSFGNSAPQLMPVLNWVIGKEDCLYLNVWRPRSQETNLPVYLFIHGGGNSIGSGNQVPDYYGHAAASGFNAVFISINYRLGPLGWFAHPALDEAAGSGDLSAEDRSGNYGTLDILQSLKWVRENIRAFGGDPNRVVIAGESAGAMNILSLLISPLAKGLFQGAVLESGGPRITSMSNAYAASHDLLVRLLIKDGKARDRTNAGRLIRNMRPAEIRAYLYSKKPGEFIRVLKGWMLGMTAFPSIIADGYVLPSEGYTAFDRGAYPVKVPLILGSNKEETKLFLSFDKKLDWKSPFYSALAKYGSMKWKIQAVDHLAASLSAFPDQPPVYTYRFDWGSVDEKGFSPMPGNLGRRLGACHTMEIPFFLGTRTFFAGILFGQIFNKRNLEGRVRLTAVIMKYLKNFLYTGNPNGIVGNVDSVWNPWTPGANGHKGVIFDADYSKAIVSFQTQELTMDMLDSEMRNELAGPLYGEVLKRLER